MTNPADGRRRPRKKPVIVWIGAALVVLLVSALGYYHFVLDWQGRPICHKQIMLGLLTVMHPSGGDILHDPQAFPNVNGSSVDSLTTIHEQMADRMGWTNDYNYVPGLRENDPSDLLLMYFNRPTRWNWHGPPPTIFKTKAWIIIPVDFDVASGFRADSVERGECSERVSQEEFRRRLRVTLDFVRTNERPNWKAIVAEHEKFLSSLQDKR